MELLEGQTEPTLVVLWYVAPVGDELTSPRVAWHPSGGVLFASSQQDATVHAWELADARGKPARALAGHTAAVRDLAHDASADVLVTASFDKTVRVWGVT